MNKLITDNVALDTNFFISQNFLQGNLVKELAKHSERGRIKIYLTDIITREVLKHFRLNLIDVKSKNISGKAQKLFVLHHFEKYSSFFNLPEIDIEEDCKEFERQFQQWILENRIQVLKTDHLIIEKVMNNYFTQQPPFEQSKKTEFPDAFTLHALDTFFNSTKEKCYFITADSGITKYHSDNLIMGVDAGDVLETILRINNVTPIEFIESKLGENKKEILDHTSAFLYEALHKDIGSFYAIDGRSVDKVEKLNIKANELKSVYIIQVTNVEFLAICTIKFSVDGLVRLGPSMLQVVDNDVLYANEKSLPISFSSLVDAAVKGTYNKNEDWISIYEYSFSPLDLREVI